MPLQTSRGLRFSWSDRDLSCSTLVSAGHQNSTRLNDLQNPSAMVRWIYGVKLEDRVSSTFLVTKLHRCKWSRNTLRCNRLRWYWHVCRSEYKISEVTEMIVEGKRPRTRTTKKTWMDFVDDNFNQWTMTSNTSEQEDWWREERATYEPVQPPINREPGT